MKRLYKILIIIGAIAAVATPSIWLGVYFYAQNKVENTDVTIDNFVITELSNETLDGRVTFSISDPISVDASFRITSFNFTYDETILGTGEVTTESFSASEASHQTNFTLDITNTIAFESFIDDFSNLDSLEIQIVVSLEFLGALESLPDKTVTKTIEMGGLGAMSLKLESFEIEGTSGDNLDLQFNVVLNNTSPVEINITTLTCDIITENMTKICTITQDDYFIKTSLNYMDYHTTFTGPKSELDELMSNYISGINQTFYLNYSIVCGDLNNFTLERDLYEVDFFASPIDLIEIDVQMISLSVTAIPSISVGYQIDTLVTLNNPVGFEVDIIAFEGILQFDDNDDSSFPLIGSYSAQDDIFLTAIDLNWSTTPITLTGYGHDSDTFSLTDNNVEKGVRLYDEYYNDNDLHVDIVSGILYLEIGNFSIEVSVTIEHIYVDSS